MSTAYGIEIPSAESVTLLSRLLENGEGGESNFSKIRAINYYEFTTEQCTISGQSDFLPHLPKS